MPASTTTATPRRQAITARDLKLVINIGTAQILKNGLVAQIQHLENQIIDNAILVVHATQKVEAFRKLVLLSALGTPLSRAQEGLDQAEVTLDMLQIEANDLTDLRNEAIAASEVIQDFISSFEGRSGR